MAGAAVGVAGAGAVLALADLNSPLRAPLTLFFLLVAPGAAIAAALPGVDPLSRAVVALLGSVTVNLLVAQVLIATQNWSVRGGVAAIAVLSSLSLLVPLLRHQSDHERR
ncbi:hypothetical protein [Streptomyces gobiensis]|uniref:hypothetical protein n=1 Tax=Streptomyces gobiensis TaxID=2875706 RepID=UPI001E600454|nr:hypothetical protein [Streptomyces gobiensis]UGY90566.1 hypothetical protein test1122_01705 [Streptomyces gobiensis]